MKDFFNYSYLETDKGIIANNTIANQNRLTYINQQKNMPAIELQYYENIQDKLVAECADYLSISDKQIPNLVTSNQVSAKKFNINSFLKRIFTNKNKMLERPLPTKPTNPEARIKSLLHKYKQPDYISKEAIKLMKDNYFTNLITKYNKLKGF